MSAARRHRRFCRPRSGGRGPAQAGDAPAITVGTVGGYQMVMKGTAVYLLQPPASGMPAALAEALERRNRATLDGFCECGGRRHLGAIRPGHTGQHHFLHEEDCIAHDRALAEIAKRAGWERAS